MPSIEDEHVADHLSAEAEGWSVARQIHGASEDARRQIAEDVAEFVYSNLNARVFNDVRDDRKIRITSSGSDVTDNASGEQIKLPGESYFDHLNFIGSVDVESRSRGRQANIRLGGGADCMFDYLSSDCWADEVAAGRGVEGQSMPTQSGCTFKIFSTPALMMTQVGTDMVAAGSSGNFVAFMCGGEYTGAVTVTSGSTSVGTLRVVGAGIERTKITGDFSIDILNTTNEYVILEHFTVNGDLNTSADASVGDRMRFSDIKCTTLSFGADADDVKCDHLIVTGTTTIGSNSSHMYFLDCEVAGLLNSGNLNNFYFLGGKVTGQMTLQQWDTVYIDTQFLAASSVAYHFKGTGSGCRGLVLKGYLAELTGASAAKNYIEFDQGATVMVDTFIDVICEKPPSTTFEVHYINNIDTEAMRGVQVRLHCGITSASVILEDMAGGYASVTGEFIDSTFYLTPNRAKVTVTAGSNNYILSGDGSGSAASTLTDHTLLDAAHHTDTATDAVSRGSIIVGNATPAWDELLVGTGHLGGDGTDVAYVKDAFAQIAAPAVTDDSGDGYVVGSRWYDTTNDKEYVALDVTVGAAVWKETTASGGAGDVATDAIWDAKGDLAGGTGANTADNLAVGANGSVLIAASGETTGLKWLLPTKTITLTASSGIPRVTSGAPPANIYDSGSNDVTSAGVPFDGVAIEYLTWSFPAPRDWDLSTVTAIFYWRSPNAANTDSVVWGIRGLASSDADDHNAAMGTGATVTDANQSSTTKTYVTAATGACTIAGTPAKGDKLFIEVYRDPTAGGDTMAADAVLTDVVIFYTTTGIDQA